MSYWNCRFCRTTGRRGCLACQAESDKAYAEAFPDGPQPIATFDTSTPEKRAALAVTLTDVFESAEKIAADRAAQLEITQPWIISEACQRFGLTREKALEELAKAFVPVVVKEQLQKAEAENKETN